MVGDTIQLPSSGTVEVEANAMSIFPILILQIVQQGRVVASTESVEQVGGVYRMHLKETMESDPSFKRGKRFCSE